VAGTDIKCKQTALRKTAQDHDITKADINHVRFIVFGEDLDCARPAQFEAN